MTITLLKGSSTHSHTMQYFFCLILSTTLLAHAVSATDQIDEPIAISPAAMPIKYDNVIETVNINNELYQVPEPWAGNRLFPTSRNLDELRQIPKEFTYKGSEIYILAEAYPSLVSMLNKASLDGIDLKVESAYRSINYQTSIFIRMLDKGRTFDDIIRYVAPPGYSQHMLGSAMDFYPSNWEFAETAQYKWLQENGTQFGFEETYSKNNRFRMPWEAWHWKYVGEPESVDEMVVESEIEDSEPEKSDAAEDTVAEGAAAAETVEEISH
ncbi:MAG: M15 family metallopeptidase [Desulfocapsaceae bacterium]